MSPWRKIVIGILLAALGAVAASWVTGIVQGDVAPRTQVILDAHTLRSSRPVLTAAQTAELIQVIQKDRSISSLLVGRPYRALTGAVWTMSTGAIIGGVVRLTVTHPVKLHGPWLALQYDCHETSSTPYVSVPYAATRLRVSGIITLVDLRSRRVVSTEPEGAASMSGMTQISRPHSNVFCQTH